MKAALVVVPVLLAVAGYLLFPPLGHGDHFNPLRVTDVPLAQYNQENFTHQYLNGDWEIIPVYHKPINSWEEVELAPVHTGWGSNKENGLYAYRMSDELIDRVCDPFDVVKAQVDSQTDVQVVEHTSPHGPNPVGCGAAPRREHRNLVEEPLKPAEALYFNSNFFTAEKLAAEIKTPVFISSFFSHYARRLLSAPWHNALAPSIAVTCTGDKWWTFVAPRGVGKYGSRSFNGATFPRGIDEDEPLYLIKTTRGSVISFPPYWPHFVISMPTPSFMYTLRAQYDGSVFWNLVKRFFVERITLWNTLPPWNGKTAYENSIDKDDVFNPKCPNHITTEHFEAMAALHDRLWQEE